MDELLASLKEGDIAILDRAYNAFAKLYRHHQRGGFFVVREKDRMKSRVVKRVAKKNLPKNIISDAALLTHLVLRFLKFKAKTNCSYTRFVGFVRAVVWLKKDLMSVVRGCGIATRQNTARNETNRHTHQRNGNDNRPKIKTVTELTTVTAQKILSMGW